MIRGGIAIGLLVATLVVLPGQANGQNRERQQIMGDLRMLHEQTMRLQIQISALDESLQRLTTQLETQAEATVLAFADQRLLGDGVAGDVRILREKIDDTNVRISSMSQEVEALRVAIPLMSVSMAQLLTDPETGLSLELPAESVALSPAPSVVSAGVSPRRMYDTAWADYTNGQWVLAVEGFEAYLKMFPRSELADDAQFYIGQTHYADGQFREAVAAFEQVILNYPDGDVVPEASYKRGLTFDRLGITDRARQAFELVVTNYPDSTMATLAQQALDRTNQP
jgi:tol-pal system protein YbgF